MNIKLILLLIISQFFLYQVVFAQNSKGVGSVAAERKIALVIGNTNYDASVGRLKNPVNDANDVAKALQRLGFSLVGGNAQLDVNKKQMLELIREFGKQIKKGGVGFFYFSGHGVQVNKKNYIIPITNTLVFEDDAEAEAVDIDSVAKEMEYAENRLNILILDACRNNSLFKRNRNTEKGLTEPTRKPEGTFIAFAAGEGQTASDGTGDNGLFTQELLKNLETPNLRLDDVFRTTRNEVKKNSNGRQVPILYDSTSESITLSTANNTAIQSPPAKINLNAGEASFWNAIENSNDIEDFENYLRRIESDEFRGIYKSTAELKIVKLKKSNIAPAWVRFRATANLLLKYDFVGHFSDGLAEVNLNSSRGFVDEKGKEAVPLKYELVDSFSEDLALVTLKGNWNFIDKTGKEVFHSKYNFAMKFSEGLAAVRLSDKKGKSKEGFIDKTGKEIIPLKYDFVESFSEGLARVSLNNKQGFIDKTGKEIIPLKYDFVKSFSEGLAPANINSTNTLIDKTGKEIIPLKYDFVESFSEGLARVSLNNKQGFIDKTGKEIIPLKYDDAFSFRGYLAEVKLNGKWGVIDKTGKEIIPFKYDYIWLFSEGVIELKLNDKWGLTDKAGKEITAIKYDDIWCSTFSNEGFIGIMINGKKGFVDIYGNEYFDF